MRVVICGGGAIGASIAYFLSCRGIAAAVVEQAVDLRPTDPARLRTPAKARYRPGKLDA